MAASRNNRRGGRPGPLDSADLPRLLSHYDTDSLWAVLSAAGASPSTRSRWTSVLHLVHAAIRVESGAQRRLTAKDLPRLLRMVREADPDLVRREDFIAEDPRGLLQMRVHGRLRRLFPGNIERPVADLERALTLGDLLDDDLVPHHGFGIHDVVEVIIGHVDRQLARTSSSWPGGDLDLDRPTLTDDEVCAGAGMDEETFSGRLAAAADYLTVSAADVEYEAGDPMSVFGTTARVLLPNERTARWLPLCALPEVLNQAVSRLGAEVAAAAEVEQRFAEHVAARVRRRLWRFSPVVIGTPDQRGGVEVTRANAAQWIVPFGTQRLLAVQVVASLTGDVPQFGVPAVVAAARAGARGRAHRLALPRGYVDLEVGGTVVPMVVAAAGAHLVTGASGEALVLSLEDLDWIAATAEHDTDLLHFATELSSAGQPRMMALETINIWEWWRSNGGALSRGGQPASAMLFEQHRGSAEWERGVQWTPLERALLLLDLPPARDWDVVEVRADATAQLARWGEKPADAEALPLGQHVRSPVELVTLHLGPVPATVSIPVRSGLDEAEAAVLTDLPGAIAFALAALNQIWAATCDAAGIKAVRLRLRTGDGGPPCSAGAVWLDGRRLDAELVINVPVLAGEADGNPAAARAAVATGLREVLERAGTPTAESAAFESAWLAAAPTLTVTSYPRITERTRARAPIEVESALEAGVARTIAGAVRAAAVRPGRYPPVEAKDLDRDLLAPMAMRVLQERLAGFSTRSVIAFGMAEIERILMRQDTLLRGITQSAEHLELSWDPVQERHRISQQYLRLRRTAEFVVEVALLSEVNIGPDVDERGWAEALAAGAAYFDATQRSESLHYQLVPSGMEITGSYELRVIEWDDDHGARRFNDAEFAQQVADEQMRGPLQGEDDPRWDDLAGRADEEFREKTGTTMTDISMALLALAAWPLDEDEDDAVNASCSDVVQQVRAGTELEQSRAEAAVDALLSRSEDYRAEPWAPWRLRARTVRLLTRPLPMLSDGSVVIAPHYCEAAFRVYQGYWNHGLLPWTAVGSPALERAMADMRTLRNRQLEDQADALLRSAGWRTIVRIKPGHHARLNVPKLTTEIDIVAGRPGSDVIELLEVKDPGPVFTAPDIRRQFNQFFDGSSSYSSKLDRKIDEVAPFADQVAQALGLPSGPAYRVVARFVTRQTVPAAFAGAAHTFTALPNLLEAVRPTDRP